MRGSWALAVLAILFLMVCVGCGTRRTQLSANSGTLAPLNLDGKDDNPQEPGVASTVGESAFWNIPYAQRLERKGVPALDRNFYDGSLYLNGDEYLDYVVDLNNTGRVAMRAIAAGIDMTSMRFSSSQFILGIRAVYDSHIAGGWASSDRDYDAHANLNCASYYGNVTQHYSGCWTYNLGSDADSSGGSLADGNWGPHMHKGSLVGLGLAHDNSDFSRVRRITRFVR